MSNTRGHITPPRWAGYHSTHIITDIYIEIYLHMNVCTKLHFNKLLVHAAACVAHGDKWNSYCVYIYTHHPKTRHLLFVCICVWESTHRCTSVIFFFSVCALLSHLVWSDISYMCTARPIKLLSVMGRSVCRVYWRSSTAPPSCHPPLTVCFMFDTRRTLVWGTVLLSSYSNTTTETEKRDWLCTRLVEEDAEGEGESLIHGKSSVFLYQLACCQTSNLQVIMVAMVPT